MDYAELQGVVQAAALTISDRDDSVHTVGLSSERGRLALRVLRRSTLRSQGAALPVRFEGFAVRVEETLGPPVPLYKIPGASAQAATLPEQQRQRPLALGLQIQNIDHDGRKGTIADGYRTVGTPCCFALREGGAALLSNNHVLAGENGAQPGDRVQQPGALEAVPEGIVAELSAFVPLVFTSEGQLGMASGVNVVDAAIARLAVGVDFTRSYLPHQPVAAPTSVREPRLGERVYKVGRTTGLTRGRVVSVLVEAGPVGYDGGAAFFRRSFLGSAGWRERSSRAAGIRARPSSPRTGRSWGCSTRATGSKRTAARPLRS